LQFVAFLLTGVAGTLLTYIGTEKVLDAETSTSSFRVTATSVAAAALLAVGFALLVRAALPTDERNAVIINLAVFCINGTLVALVFRFLDRAPLPSRDLAWTAALTAGSAVAVVLIGLPLSGAA
jgi:hypothetical protein